MKIRICHGEGANPPRTEAALRSFGFETSPIMLHEIKSLTLDTTGVLSLLGGWYHFDEETDRAIINFVKAAANVSEPVPAPISSAATSD